MDRGVALVSMAAAIALGATSMSDIEVLSHLEPVLGAPPSDTTIRRTLEHLLKITSPRRQVLFTCGWAITAADEQAIALLPAGAWKPGVDQDGDPERDRHVAERQTLRYLLWHLPPDSPPTPASAS